MSQAPLSPIFEFANRFVDEQSALDPNSATGRGIPGFDHLLTDLSPAGYEQRAAHLRGALAELRALPVTNDDDRRAQAFITERFDTSLANFDAGNWLRAISAIAWPALAFTVLFIFHTEISKLFSRVTEGEFWGAVANHRPPTRVFRGEEVARSDGGGDQW